MKTLLLPKNLANEKRGGDSVKPPMLSFSADAPPPPPGPGTKRDAQNYAQGPATTSKWLRRKKWCAKM